MAARSDRASSGAANRNPCQKKNVISPIDFKDRFPALDGIRAVAVTLVFMDHFGGGAHGGRVLNLIN
jgi:hypothetical protein